MKAVDGEFRVGRSRGPRIAHPCSAIIALFFSVLLTVLIVAAPARADDATPPDIGSFSLTPTTVNTASEGQTVTVRVALTDAASGVASEGDVASNWAQSGLALSPEVGTQRIYGWLSLLPGGTPQDGVFTATMVLPKCSAAGLWHVSSLQLVDGLGNSVDYDWTYLEGRFGAGCATVNNVASVGDAEAPLITALKLTPSEVDTNSEQQSVSVEVTLTDSLVGVASEGEWSVDWGQSSVQLSSLDGGQQTTFWLKRVGGTAQSGDFEATAVLPVGSRPGLWRVSNVSLVDKLGNYANLDWPDVENAFGAENTTLVNLAGPTDTTPPQITSFKLTPGEVDTESGERTLTVEVTLTDDQAGVASEGDLALNYSQSMLMIAPLIGTQKAWFLLKRVSGDALDGAYTATAVLPEGAKEGLWRIADFQLIDKLGNSTHFDADSLSALLPTAEGITIANTATAQQVTIDRAWTISSASTTVTFPADTVVMRGDAGRFAFYEMTAEPFTLEGALPTPDLEGVPLATLRLGIPGLNLSFSQPVTVSMTVGSAYEGQTLLIQSLTEGGDAWANETTCDVVDGRCTFTVNHATRFIASVVVPPDTIFFVGGVDPVNSDGSSVFKLKSTIPLKLHLTDAHGQAVTNLSPRLYLSKLSGSVWGTELEALATNQPDSGNLFRLVGDRYMFNLGAKPLSTGTWRLRIDLGNGQETTATFSLR